MSRQSKEDRRREALYRFHVIAPLLPPRQSKSERAEKLRQILRDPPRHPFREPPRPLALRTVYRWLETYRTATGDPLAALEPKARKDRGRSRRVPPDLLAQVIRLREESPRLGVEEILKRIDHKDREAMRLRTVARALLDAGYDLRDKRRRADAKRRGPRTKPDWDLLRWEADFPNEVWQVDSTPSIWLAAGRHRQKPVRLELVNIIDDHSRRLVGGGFTERLRLTDLLRLLVPAIARFGCPGLLYADRAKIHGSTILVEGLARLGGVVVLGTAGHAPGHGKVERIHQTIDQTLLEDLRRDPVETCEEACARYDLWCERYADEVHGETGERPRSRWERIAGNARIPGAEELRWAFRGRVERTVSEVGAIELGGRTYEAPQDLRRAAPRRVWVRYDLLDDSQVWIDDDAGLRHACPLYRTRSHTERRARRQDAGPEGIPFADLFPQEPPLEERRADRP